MDDNNALYRLSQLEKQVGTLREIDHELVRLSVRVEALRDDVNGLETKFGAMTKGLWAAALSVSAGSITFAATIYTVIG